MNVPSIHTTRKDSLLDFLELRGFEIEVGDHNVLRVVRNGELPTFVQINETALYFEVDLGSLKGIGTKNLYFELLNANSEILPVSFGINNSNPEDPRLVLVESRVHSDLSDEEILAVFDALELAVDAAAKILEPHIA